jgi:hypothetical protein
MCRFERANDIIMRVTPPFQVGRLPIFSRIRYDIVGYLLIHLFGIQPKRCPQSVKRNKLRDYPLGVRLRNFGSRRKQCRHTLRRAFGKPDFFGYVHQDR